MWFSAMITSSKMKTSSTHKKKSSSRSNDNLRLARQLLGGPLTTRVAKSLERLSNEFDFSLSNDELQFIQC